MTTPFQFLELVTRDRDYDQQIAHVENIEARPASFQSTERPLDDRVQTALLERGVRRLYVHQALAIDAARRGENVVVATSTASGKSLCYTVPAVEAAYRERASRSLLLFPTKALAQDQLRSLRAFAPSLAVATFDGDTAARDRVGVRQSAQIVLSNPDMLHLGILPRHAAWSTFLRNLKYVVIDEAHVYRGVFGSHVANVMRRLRRICDQYGSNPVFIASSATIANPGEHLYRLIGEPATVVDEDGSPHGPRQFVFWNPPLIEETGGRRSANGESANLFAALVRQRIRTIAFTKTRRLAELVYLYARDSLKDDGRGFAEKIASYRAGYLASDRRQIEQRLFSGDLIGVTATTALELGIDVGDLSATILTGYPGSIASAWQQAGRAGRGSGESISFLIGLDNPLDQYLMRHPEAFFGQGNEQARINPSNRQIAAQHVLCAAHEAPIGLNDLDYFGEALLGAVNDLADTGRLRKRGDRWFPAPTVEYPAAEVDIRSASGEPFDLMCEGRTVETIEAETAYFQVHPGAVYLHQGETLLVEELDLVTRVARARFADVPYYTVTDDTTELTVRQVLEERPAGPTSSFLGEVEVTTQVIGYKRKRQFTDEVLAKEPLDLPATGFGTVALWWTVPDTIKAEVDAARLDFAGGLHAAEHAAIGLLPLFALCDRRDIGGLSTPLHLDTASATIFIYDGHAGGVGIAERGYQELERLWETTLQLLDECPCDDGCPSCIQSPKCGNNNDILDKEAAKIILRALCDRAHYVMQ